MSQITVISGPERRRGWNDAQKRTLVAAASAPGVNVADIARRADWLVMDASRAGGAIIAPPQSRASGQLVPL